MKQIRVRRRNTRVLYIRPVHLYIRTLNIYVSRVQWVNANVYHFYRMSVPPAWQLAPHSATGIWRDVWPLRRRHDEERRWLWRRYTKTKMAVGMKNRSCFRFGLL